jgi:hypothetical protein
MCNEPFGFNKMLGNYRVVSQLLASRVLFSSIQLVRGENRNVYMFLVGKSEGKRPIGRPRRR